MEMKMIKETRRQCESEIRAIIDMFEKQTGCIIYGIGINRIDTTPFGWSSGKTSKVTHISLDVRIEN